MLNLPAQCMPSDFEELDHSVRRANLIRTPSMNIATFGETRYLYRHLAKISDSQTKVREGSIEVKKASHYHQRRFKVPCHRL